MRFPTSTANRAAEDNPVDAELSSDGHFPLERRGRSMSMGTRLDLFFLSLWLIAAGVALFVFLYFCLYGFMRSFALG